MSAEPLLKNVLRMFSCCCPTLQANKVPQERVPADVAAKITAEMLQAFQQALGPAGAVQLPKHVFTK